MIGARFGAPAAGSRVTLAGQSLDFSEASLARGAAGWMQRRDISAAQLLSQSSFQLSLNDDNATGKGAGWTVWGRGDFSKFEGKPEAGFSLDGEIVAGYLGLDYRLDSDTLLETRLSGIHPYAWRALNERLSVWGMVGYAHGEAEVTVAGGNGMKTDLEMRMLAGGVRAELPSVGRSQLALKADASTARVSADALGATPAVDVDTQRVRLLLESRAGWSMADGARLTPRAELGLRLDGGDAETGLGAELGAGLSFANDNGLDLDVSARVLLAHEESDLREWGASVQVRLDPGASGRGLSLALGTRWGQSASSVNALWDTQQGVEPRDERAATAVGIMPDINLELGYGTALGDGTGGLLTRFLPGNGTLTRFAALQTAANGQRCLRAGTRLNFASDTDLQLEFYVERARAGGDAADHRLGLTADWRF